MAHHNHPPPFFAPPFAFAPPQPPQPLQHPPALAAQSPDYRAQAQHGFQSIPGLPPPPPPTLPGLNYAAYAHNSQQPPGPPAAWSQLPPDPHLSMSMFHQHGVFPPPPLPGLGMPPASLPQTPQNHPIPRGLPPHHPPPHVPPPPAAPMNERVQEVRDSDKEEGELSDGDGASRLPAARARGNAPVRAPSSVPIAASATSRVEEAYNPDCPAAGQSASHLSSAKPAQRESPPSLADKIQRDRDEAKQFVKTLNSNGIGYRTLAQEQLDLELLRGLYQSLNLPSEPAPILPPKSNDSRPDTLKAQPTIKHTVSPVDNTKTKPLAPVVKTNLVASTSAKAIVSPITQADRKDYVARLQAARMAKQAAEAKTNLSQPASQANSATKPATPAPAVQEMHETSTPAAKATITDEQRRLRTTELVKQRLKELKGKPKSGPPNKSNTIAETPSTTRFEQGLATPKPAALSGLPVSSNQGDPLSMPMFPGIPGLFLNPPSQNARDSSTPSKPSPSIPQKRPAPSDVTGTSTPHGSFTPYSRPLGQSPHATNCEEDDSMIIQVSDDDSNGSDMDLDDDQQGPKATVGPPAFVPNTSEGVGTLSNFPSRSGSTKPASPAVSTPGPQTPSTQAREKELEDKEKQLAAMRLTLKKKLAEKREKDRAAAAAAAAVTTSSPLRQSSSTVDPPSAIVTEPNPSPATTNLRTSPASGPSTAADAFADSNRDHKRLRRAEIQSRLPTLDAEIANNAIRMARLTEEMNKLLAENEKITKDKEQLTNELEGLGIDTEGMSHAQLRAKKDEIEREKSPEKETLAQDTPMISQPSPGKQSPSLLLAAETTKTAGLPTRTVPAASSGTSMQLGTLPGLVPAVLSVPRLFADETSKNELSAVDAETVADVTKTSIMPGQAGTDNAGSTKPLKATDPGSVTPPDDEDFYSPLPPDVLVRDLEAPPDAAPPAVPEPAANAPMSPSEEGEVEMSESSDEEEEEYEPEDLSVNAEARLQAAQGPDVGLGRSRTTSPASAKDEEDYEPPDVDQEMSDEPIQVAATDSREAMPHNEADDGAMDIATSSSEESTDSASNSDDETTPEPELDTSSSATHAASQPPKVGDDVVPNLAVREAAATIAQEATLASMEHEPCKFTPYESPLRMFKSYRYHPSYANDVSGGFLSWTFSHQLDPEKCLCQYESVGESCNDTACPGQHFRDIGITGEKLLVQLGTANPGENAEERQKWNDGLRGVLKELRVKNIKDPNGIAVEIAKYRRQFLNDETRVVNLPHDG